MTQSRKIPTDIEMENRLWSQRRALEIFAARLVEAGDRLPEFSAMYEGILREWRACRGRPLLRRKFWRLYQRRVAELAGQVDPQGRISASEWRRRLWCQQRARAVFSARLDDRRLAPFDRIYAGLLRRWPAAVGEAPAEFKEKLLSDYRAEEQERQREEQERAAWRRRGWCGRVG